MVVLVTGCSGQLGQALQYIAGDYSNIQFYFASSSEADITKLDGLHEIFQRIQPEFCINTAAYTAVDKAENDIENAYLINSKGAKNLAEVCHIYNTTLVHISTDFVFDGGKSTPYSEEDITNPQNIYGNSKLKGEIEIAKNLEQYFIVRTSWLYSQFGNNFLKTMLRLAKEKKSLSVVNDQIGTPTNAVDLAKALILIILSGSKNYGIYNFSNEGSASWYDFAKEIFELNKVESELISIPTTSFPTPAIRPRYSVLDKAKIKNEFKIQIINWKDSLH